MSDDVIISKKWDQAVDQAQGYLINVNLFRCALKERKPKGGGGGVHQSPNPILAIYELSCTSKV